MTADPDRDTGLLGQSHDGPHHRRIHDPRYTVQRLPNGKVAFHRRTETLHRHTEISI
jgi:hypothetical protein